MGNEGSLLNEAINTVAADTDDESLDSNNNHRQQVRRPQQDDPIGTTSSLPFGLGRLSSSSASSAIGFIRSEERMSTLSEVERENVQATLSLLTSRTNDYSSFSSRSSNHPLSQGISPLLLSSDAGLAGVLAILTGTSCHHHSSTAADPLHDLSAYRTSGRRSAVRPRVIASLSPTNESKKSNNRNKSPTAADGIFSNPHQQCNQKHKQRSCDSPTSSSFFPQHLLDEFRCPICLDVFDRPVSTLCRHVFCVECIIASLVRQSICPLCRSTVYVKHLRPLSQVANDQPLKLIHQRYQDLLVECPKCTWIGTMAAWNEHVDSPDCREQREARKRQKKNGPAAKTGLSGLRSGQQSGEASSCSSSSQAAKAGIDGKNNLRHRQQPQRRSQTVFTSGKEVEVKTTDAGHGRSKRGRKQRNGQPNECMPVEQEIGTSAGTSSWQHRVRNCVARTEVASNSETVRNNERCSSSSFVAEVATATASHTTTRQVTTVTTASVDTSIADAPSPYRVNFEQIAPLPRPPSLSGAEPTPSPEASRAAAAGAVAGDSADVEFSTDRLACWLVDHSPGVAIRLYVISHRMECTAGALGSILFSGVTHTQAILEFESQELYEKRRRNSVSPLAHAMGVRDETDVPKSDVPNQQQQAQNNNSSGSCSVAAVDDDADCDNVDDYDAVMNQKRFLSMEIFADRLGTEWAIHEAFPPLKSSAHKISLYDHLGIPTSTIVDFLLSSRHRRYNLLSWNCQTFIADFKKVAGVPNDATSIREIPRPTSYSEDLMQLLRQVIDKGDLPVLQSYQLNENSNYNHQPTTATANNTSSSTPQSPRAIPDSSPAPASKGWTSLFRILRRHHQSSTLPESSPLTSLPDNTNNRSDNNTRQHPSSSSSSSSSTAPISKFPATPVLVTHQPPMVRIRAVTMCLFPAEDRHRVSLRPAAHVSAFLSRTLGLVRPPNASSLLASGQACYVPPAAVAPSADPQFSRFPARSSSSGSATAAAEAVTATATTATAAMCAGEPDFYQQHDDYYDPGLDMQNHVLNDSQIRLRYFTLPVLIFHIQTLRILEPSSSSSSSSSSSTLSLGHNGDSGNKADKQQRWDTLGFLSLEFRSDCGLWWHLYHEQPAGLNQATEKGGTDVVVSAQTSFSLEALRDCLMELRSRPYHAIQWAGWEFSEAVLKRCCPNVCHHFLDLPIADSFTAT